MTLKNEGTKRRLIRLGYAQSGLSSLCAQWVTKDPKFLHRDSEDSDQTELMHRLIGVEVKNISILHLSFRTSDLQFSLVFKHMHLSFKSV